MEVCQAVRRAVGDDFTIMLDSTWAYEYPAAVRVGQAIQELGSTGTRIRWPTTTSTAT